MPGFSMSHALWLDHAAHEFHKLQQRRLCPGARPDVVELQRDIQLLNWPKHHMRRKLLCAGRIVEADSQSDRYEADLHVVVADFLHDPWRKPGFPAAESFAVSVLCPTHRDVAMRFATRGADKFSDL
jgi:hypothetical protein